MRIYLTILALSLALVGCGNSTADTSDPGTLGERFRRAVPEDEYGTFAAALRTPALADVLEELDTVTNPHTVFVPNNAAFAGYFEAQGITQEEFLARDDLREFILTYIVRGSYNGNDIVAGATFENMNGTTLTVSAEEDEVLVNGAPIWGELNQIEPPFPTGFIYYLTEVIAP